MNKKGNNILIIIGLSIIIVAWISVYCYFNFVPKVSNKVCFSVFGIPFGCNAEVIQYAKYYEPNSQIDLNEEFLLEGERSNYHFYTKVNGKLVDKVSFSETGDQKITLILDYNGKKTKVEKVIKIGDGTPPQIVQKSIPTIKAGEQIMIQDYVEVVDKDPNAGLTNPSLIANEVGEQSTTIYATDTNGNIGSLEFKYIVIEDLTENPDYD